jgi:hypothetical protein
MTHRPSPRNILQEYLESLAEGAGALPTERQQRLLHAWAELQYQLHGGGRCSVCHASVRHVVPVRAEHADGTIAEFACLCTRCLEAERVISLRVVLTVGQAQVEYTGLASSATSLRAYAP